MHSDALANPAQVQTSGDNILEQVAPIVKIHPNTFVMQIDLHALN